MAKLEITVDNFAAEVEQAAGTVLLDFWAPWCGYCRMIDPVLEAVDADMEAAGRELTVGKINIDEQPELAERFGVDTIPTLIVYRDGKMLTQTVGFKNKTAVLDLLK
ncbi:MAG: thioredoxin [Firmicutes bacterium]|nr:thioredoxin [Bacillota bacterium]